jgi:predicted phosphodiesterase
MTRWGFITDVHGNLPALEQALELCRQCGAERFAFLGDFLGRGDSDGCIRLIRKHANLAVVGNRDLDWADRVDPETRSYVLSLPRQAAASDFLAVHGDERLTPGLSSTDRRRGFLRTRRLLEASGQRLLVFGHTHQARVWRIAGLTESPELLAGSRLALPASSGCWFVVNVGTTGLPFPGKGPPSCAVYDDQERWLEHLVLGPGRGKAPGL